MAKEKTEQTGKSLKIVRCTCNHEFQDKRYGKGMRIANKTGDQNPKYIYTVCKREHS